MIPQSLQVRLVKRMTDMRLARRKWHIISPLTWWSVNSITIVSSKTAKTLSLTG